MPPGDVAPAVRVEAGGDEDVARWNAKSASRLAGHGEVGEELGNVMEGATSRRWKASAAVNWLSSFGLEIRAPPRICVSYDG